MPVDNVAGGGDKRSNLWDITLGETQYSGSSRHRHLNSQVKFVFAHHVLGNGRGGIENAGLTNGRKNQKENWEFDKMAPVGNCRFTNDG